MERLEKILRDNTAWFVGGIWTVIQIMDFVLQDKNFHNLPIIKTIGYILIILFFVGLICGIVYWTRKKKIVIKTSEDNIIELKKCDISTLFSEKDYAFVFSTSNFMNTDSKFIEKEVLELYLKSNDALWANIQDAIQKSLVGESYTNIDNFKVTLGGNSKSYQIGTVAFVNNNLYLLAITEIRETETGYMAESKKEFVDLALNNLWKRLTEQERQKIICMPAIGSGKSKAFSQQSKAIKNICDSFIRFQKENKKKICDKLIVVANDKHVDLEIIGKSIQIDIQN